MEFFRDTFNPSDNIIEEPKTLNDIKNLDGGYNEFFYKVTDENGKLKRRRVVSYNSGDADCHIRNAVTGHYTPHFVGSTDEDLYFSVIDSRGLSTKGHLVFYYESPEQYEREHRVELNEHIKQQWSNKRSMRLANMK